MIPATKRIHHGLFVAKSFTSSFKDVFSSLIGFTRSFVHEKVRKNIIAANMAKTTAAICQPNACDGTPSTIFILLNISTNGSIRNNTKILPRMQKSFGMKTMMYESAGWATLPLTTKRMAH